MVFFSVCDARVCERQISAWRYAGFWPRNGRASGELNDRQSRPIVKSPHNRQGSQFEPSDHGRDRRIRGFEAIECRLIDCFDQPSNQEVAGAFLLAVARRLRLLKYVLAASSRPKSGRKIAKNNSCLLYTSDAADE